MQHNVNFDALFFSCMQILVLYNVMIKQLYLNISLNYMSNMLYIY